MPVDRADAPSEHTVCRNTEVGRLSQHRSPRRDDGVNALEQRNERHRLAQNDRVFTPVRDLVEIRDLPAVPWGENHRRTFDRKVVQKLERELAGLRPVVMALLRRGAKQDPNCRRFAVGEPVRWDRKEIDAGERDILLQSLEGQEVLGPDSSASERTRVDDAGVEDVRAGDLVHEEVHVFVVDDDEARYSELPSGQGRGSRAGEHEIDGVRPAFEKVDEEPRSLGEAVELAWDALPEARADRLEYGAFVAKDRERVAIRTRSQKNVVSRLLEAARDRKKVARLRRVVDVDPGSQTISAPFASA
jgi:hypothetical protein